MQRQAAATQFMFHVMTAILSAILNISKPARMQELDHTYMDSAASKEGKTIKKNIGHPKMQGSAQNLHTWLPD